MTVLEVSGHKAKFSVCDYFIGVVGQGSLQVPQNNISCYIPLSYLPELDNKTLFLKTPQVLDVAHREIIGT